MTGAVGGGADLTASWLTGALAGDLAGAAVTAVASEPVGTGQGDEMFCTMTARHARHALDLDAASLLR